MWETPRLTEKTMKKQLAWILGGAAIVGLGMAASLSACSSDDSGNPDSGTKDGTTPIDTGTKDTSTTDTSTPNDGGTETSTVDCGTIPTLHPVDGGTIFCGYPPDGGAGFSCGTGQQCCLGGEVNNSFLPEACETWGGICDNPLPDASTSPGVPIECNQNSDCTANGQSGNVCCLQGATVPQVVAGCNYDKSTQGTAIKCETAANGACTGSTDIQVCSQQSDCPNGKTCTASKWKIYQVGFCL